MDRHRKLEATISSLGSPHNTTTRIDHFDLIRIADQLSLGDRLFQKRLGDLSKVDGWIDAALLVAEAALPGPFMITIRMGRNLKEKAFRATPGRR